ncbi:MAG: FMN-binding protein [Spirochaetaceae bacterium]|jgi:fumarate reductase flavoprotein subunit|nr:FMN-binding protein [Spirochaetaceae bacterium]
MKQHFLLLVCVISFAAGCASLNFARRYNAGFWQGTAEGYAGPLSVLVETDENSIVNIEIEEEDEDPFIGREAIFQLLISVLDADSTDIDAVSGATASSNAFLEAVDNALQKAQFHANQQVE